MAARQSLRRDPEPGDARAAATRHTRRVPSVSTTRELAVAPATAERLWYDTGRWPQWVPGLEAVTAVDPGWPARPGAMVSWRSHPAGRGRVSERVLEHRPLESQRLAVRDDATEGEQTIRFTPTAHGGVTLTLALDFHRRRRNPLAAAVDLIFGRGAMAAALAATLERFAAVAELEASAGGAAS